MKTILSSPCTFFWLETGGYFIPNEARKTKTHWFRGMKFPSIRLHLALPSDIGTGTTESRNRDATTDGDFLLRAIENANVRRLGGDDRLEQPQATVQLLRPVGLERIHIVVDPALERRFSRLEPQLADRILDDQDGTGSFVLLESEFDFGVDWQDGTNFALVRDSSQVGQNCVLTLLLHS